MATATDHPGVIARPPILYGAAFLVVLGLRWIWPLQMLGRSVLLWPGVAIVALGLAMATWGRRTMSAAGTNVDPALPATALVESGPFRHSRNPLYVSLTAVYIGLTLAFDTWWGMVVLVPLAMLMHGGVVLREERYLEGKFGDAYRQYRSRVRRYL